MKKGFKALGATVKQGMEKMEKVLMVWFRHILRRSECEHWRGTGRLEGGGACSSISFELPTVVGEESVW